MTRLTVLLLLLVPAMVASVTAQVDDAAVLQRGSPFPQHEIGGMGVRLSFVSQAASSSDSQVITGKINTFWARQKNSAVSPEMDISIDSLRLMLTDSGEVLALRLTQRRAREIQPYADGITLSTFEVAPVVVARAVKRVAVAYRLTVTDRNNNSIVDSRAISDTLLRRGYVDKGAPWKDSHAADPLEWPTAEITYTVPAEPTDSLSKVSVLITMGNVQGQVVDTLVNDLEAPGEYTVSWDPPVSMPNGMYFCLITIGTRTDTKRFTLLR